jgi:hypothetical protein
VYYFICMYEIEQSTGELSKIVYFEQIHAKEITICFIYIINSYT